MIILYALAIIGGLVVLLAVVGGIGVLLGNRERRRETGYADPDLHQAALAFRKLEADNAAECLAALTPADIEWLHWWGWDPPLDVLYRMNSYRQQEREHAAEAEAAALESRLAAGEKLTQDQLAAVANARISGRRALPTSDSVTSPHRHVVRPY